MEAIEWLTYLAIFGSVFYLVFLFFDKLEETAEELQEQQLEHGDKTLAELYINMTPGAFLFVRVSIAVAMFLLGFAIINPMLGVLLAAGGYLFPAWILKNMKLKRLRKLEAQLVDALELMGNGLKSGLTLNQAIELLVKEFPPPISQEFNYVLAENRLGVELTESLERMAQRLDSVIFHVLATGVNITKRCGGDLTEIFNNIADTIREQANVEGKLNAVTAQGRFQGQILSFMPFALIGILYFIDRAHVETLFGYTFGIWAIAAVVVMVALAQVWIGRLLAIDV